jgi:hypothetical protein
MAATFLVAVFVLSLPHVGTTSSSNGEASHVARASEDTPRCESTATVVSESDDYVTLRFEADWRPGTPRGGSAEGGPVRFRPERADRYGGSSWLAVSSAIGPFTVLVEVPPTGAIETEVTGVPAPAGTGPAASLDVSEPAILRDVRVVQVTYAPGDGAPIELTLRSAPGAGTNEKSGPPNPVSPIFRRIYEGQIINYSGAPTGVGLAPLPRDGGRGRDAAPTGARYLVITGHSLEEAIMPLVEWRAAAGLRPKVVSILETGFDFEDVQDYVSNAYHTWDIPPEFLLIVGDSELVPTYRPSVEFHSDNRYAAVDGNDFLSDILVGRLPADTVDELETMIAKCFAYDRPWLADDPTWMLSGSLLLRDDFDMGDMIYYENTGFVEDLMDSLGFAPVDFLAAADGIDISDTYASLNAGPGYVSYRGVAGDFWAQPFTFAPTMLTNVGELPIVMSATCFTGAFVGDPHFSELWLKAGSPDDLIGGAAFYGTCTFGQGEALSRKRGYVCEGFFGSALREGTVLGEATLAAKANLFAHVYDQEEYEGWSLLGDPALSLWTAQASPLDVALDVAVDYEDVALTLTVTSDRGPVADAAVTCAMDTSLFMWGETDGGGEIVFSFEAALPCSVDLTAATKNAIPWNGRRLLGPAAAYLIDESADVDDAGGGNGDGYLSPGETAEVSFCVSNIGGTEATDVSVTLRTPNEFVTLVDSVATFPDIPSGGTACSNTPFTLELSETWPGGAHIPVTLAMAYAGTSSTWRPAPLETVTGDLAVTSFTVDDATPGGNGDGAAAPGETAGLTVTLGNESGSGLDAVRAYLSSDDPYVSVAADHAAYGDVDEGSNAVNVDAPFVVSIAPSVPSDYTATLRLRVEADAASYAYAESLTIDLDVFTSLHTLPSGPDFHGYYAYDSTDTLFAEAPEFEWIEIAPPGPGVRMNRVSDNDDDTKLVFPPFINTYYDDPTPYAVLCSNGFVALEMTNFEYGTNTPIPSDLGPPSMVAPFWTDLDPSVGGDVYTWSDMIGHRFVVQYEAVRHKNSPDAETFQVVFYDPNFYPTPSGNSVILFQYKTVADPDSCTVGIESPDQRDGLQYVHNGVYDPRAAPLQDDLAVRFTTVPPETLLLPWLVFEGLAVDDSEGGNGNGQAEVGETVSLVVELSNEGLAAASGVELTLSAGDSSVAVVDSTAAIADIPAGGNGANEGDPFVLVVSDAREDSLATLWLRVGGNAGAHQRAIRVDLGLTSVEPATTRHLALNPAFPNPFGNVTTMRFFLPDSRDVELEVYNVAGRLVKVVASGPYDAGPHEETWDGTDAGGNRVANGIYFVRLAAGGENRTRKTVLIK